jgi:GntR family transcriptional regulator
MADIRTRIATGEYPPGHRLPTTEQLRDHYRVAFGSPTLTNSTVRQGITLLIEAGVLRGQQGQGVYVADEAGSSQEQ